MNKPTRIIAAAVLSLTAFGGAWAADDHANHANHGAQASAPASALTGAIVRRVDAATGRITLKHERIANLDMDAMTMVFRATKPEQFKGLKAGDKVRFQAESNKGLLMVTHIEVAK